ncbi:NHLP family bacteriocin export ABC transporter peptidase/permease/ATPase [Streptomyces spinoverrucosus]|uniref:NHLP family bacteriocin export ABC transporter peptidase/permease/ATPase n=1 Tax=Streptomyces spinoverrucosus TaxID=284043 RepID=A0A4Y3VQG6_9ACTN|nr:peptidase domain-containing ABC transporter [Streptomyces spinoverrucosus]GEC07940.1 NHLP family bacteriocin export ABC transporter peptidase/permease/ATPase [Streptomyces spinoverrucosus]GHB85863.1 NHLP family bacteriocin export ABC transporter peptidase/permease/ATPase [Streptomyces spinoverrucosus]
MRITRRRVPVRLQSTSVECGVAALAMVLGYHGRHTAVAELRDRMVLARDGASAASIARHARELGMKVRAFRAEPDALAGLALPLIAHWGMNHFVVIERFTSRGADIVDPASGRRRVTHAELDASFTGVVLEMEPTDEFEERDGAEAGLWPFVRPFLPRRVGILSAIVAASAILALFGLLPAFLTAYVVDHVLPGRRENTLLILAAGIVAYAASHAMMTLARAELLLWLQTRIDWSMMSSFLRHLMSLPYKFFQLRTGGDLLVRVSSMTYVRDAVSSQLLAVFLDAALLGIYLVVIGTKSLLFVAAILTIALTQLAIMFFSAPTAQRLTERELQALGEAQSTLLEAVTGAETVKASGAEDVVVSRWSRKFSEQLESSVRRSRLDNAIDSLLGMLGTASPLVMLVLGAYLVFSDNLSLGTMLALISLAGAALSPVAQLGRSIKTFQTIRVHLDRLRDVLDEPDETIGQGNKRVTLDEPITLADVSFRYSGDGPDALAGISLTVSPGEKIAIVGSSGSGKSTLARLILGLYDPTGGEITYGPTPLTDLDLGHLRRQCGVVTQDADIFSGSVLTNIALVKPEATLDEVVAAARLAAVHDDITRMPMGYETILGEGGSGLSGGQRQRIALARAVLHQPRVLLLDEATSHLDATTEAAVHENLSELDCTRIVIAHRLSTVLDADRILVLDQGRIVEEGRHGELVARGGAYAMLVGQQLVHD